MLNWVNTNYNKKLQLKVIKIIAEPKLAERGACLELVRAWALLLDMW
jgi:hypothetical protein